MTGSEDAAPERRGAAADWRNPWPPVGIRREPPLPSRGVDVLSAEGYAVMLDVDPVEEDRDAWQDHLRNTAVVRMFNELRIAYVASRLAPDWPRWVRRGGYAVVVREQHVRYDPREAA